MKKFKMDKLTKKQIGHFNRHIVVGDPDKCWPWVGKHTRQDTDAGHFVPAGGGFIFYPIASPCAWLAAFP